MSVLFTQRSAQLERMDVESMEAKDAAEILGALETINSVLGGVRATLSHFNRWSRSWRAGERIRIIDWGTGGADIPRALVRWGRKKGYRMEVTGVDNNPATVAYARQACKGYPEISILESNIFSVGEGHALFDYAISSLTLHHLPDAQIVELLRQSDRLTKRGIAMNDLIRSARAWAWIWTLSRLGRAHPMVRHDGPLSVKRAFKKSELHSLANKAQLGYLKVHTHFGYRYTLAGEKSR